MRRRVSAALISLLFGMACLSFVGANAQDRGVVVVASWGGSFQDAQRDTMFKPFERATGIRVVEATGPTIAKIRTMVTSGNAEWDVVSTVPGDLLTMIKQNLLERIDRTQLDPRVVADLDPRVIHPYGIGGTWGSKVIAFNTRRYPRGTHPKSWAEFWDAERFPGPRVIDAGNWVVPPIEYALLADGVAPDRLYPLDLERAYRSLARIKPHVVKWSSSPATPAQALVDGEAHLAAVALGRIMRLKEDGAPVDFEWNQGLLQHDYWAIPRGAKNQANALKFIEFVSRPEPLAELCKVQLLGPANRRAFEFMPPERARLLPSYPDNLQRQVALNPSWWAETDASGKTNLERNNEMWSRWIQQ